MTPSPIETAVSGQGGEVCRTASLVAIASVLQIAESLLPHPIPGIRLGLANMVTLVTLADLGFASAMEVAVLRTVVSSLILGSFLSPGFILSFSSAVLSTLVMWAFWRISASFPSWGLSLIGVSIVGAVAHNAAQLSLAYLLMIKSAGIFYFVPWLVISGVLTGCFTGLVAAKVLKRLREDGTRGRAPAVALRAKSSGPAGNSFLHRLAPEWKISGAAALIGFVLSAKSWFAFSAAAAGLLALMFFTRLGSGGRRSVRRKLRGVSSLAAFSFIFPALFGGAGGGAPFFSAGPVSITSGGLASGAFFASRIMLMAWTGILLNVYASPEEIAAGIRRLGRPLGFFGVPVERFAAIISISWSEVPDLSARARAVIAARSGGGGGWKRRPLGWFVELVAGVISEMYCGRDAAAVELEGKAA